MEELVLFAVRNTAAPTEREPIGARLEIYDLESAVAPNLDAGPLSASLSDRVEEQRGGSTARLGRLERAHDAVDAHPVPELDLQPRLRARSHFDRGLSMASLGVAGDHPPGPLGQLVDPKVAFVVRLLIDGVMTTPELDLQTGEAVFSQAPHSSRIEPPRLRTTPISDR